MPPLTVGLGGLVKVMFPKLPRDASVGIGVLASVIAEVASLPLADGTRVDGVIVLSPIPPLPAAVTATDGATVDGVVVVVVGAGVLSTADTGSLVLDMLLLVKIPSVF